MSRKSEQQLMEEKLGVALVNRGDIKRDELNEAIANQVLVGGQLATCLWELGIERIEKLADYMSTILRVKQVPVKVVRRTSQKVLSIFDQKFVGMHRIIPLGVKNKELSIATCEPWNLAALDDAAFHSGFRIKPFFLDEVNLTKLMLELYDVDPPGRFELEPTLREGRKPYVPATTPEPAVSKKQTSKKELQSKKAKQLFRKSTKQADENISKIRIMDIEPSKEVQSKSKAPKQSERPPTEEVIDDAWLVEEEAFDEIATDDAELEQLEEALDQREVKTVTPAEQNFEPISDRSVAQQMLSEATNRDELGEILVRFALSKGKRTLLLTRSSNIWTGWIGAGDGIDSRYVNMMMFSSDPGSCFGLVGSTGAQFLGPLAPHPVHDKLLQFLGGQKPSSVGIFPVHYRGKVVFGIYIDGGDGEYLNPDIGDMLVLAQQVPMAIERLIERRQSVAKTA